mmetsp:Transcript_23180/g.48548  ORF Transcript_23180/g.48548 Transcript_23180/m.48548 type:complete len:113 (+) Transcript_23180:212-550(+)
MITETSACSDRWRSNGRKTARSAVGKKFFEYWLACVQGDECTLHVPHIFWRTIGSLRQIQALAKMWVYFSIEDRMLQSDQRSSALDSTGFVLSSIKSKPSISLYLELLVLVS